MSVAAKANTSKKKQALRKTLQHAGNSCMSSATYRTASELNQEERQQAVQKDYFM